MTGTALRVFIVDDHPLVREWLVSLLRLRPDFRIVGEAEDVDDALSAMRRTTPDIAVVDLSLKTGSGLDLIKALRVELPATRVLVLSMHEELTDIERAFRAGARGYVMKRESTSQIVTAIREVHAGRMFAAPEVLSALTERMLTAPVNADRAPWEQFSDRELEVFRRLGAGHSTRRIADDLRVSIKTVQTYCWRMRERLGLSSIRDLELMAVRWMESQRP